MSVFTEAELSYLQGDAGLAGSPRSVSTASRTPRRPYGAVGIRRG